MSTRPAMVLGLIAIIAATPMAAGQGSHRNAATWYDRATGGLERLTEADWELIRAYGDDPTGEPGPALREILAATSGSMEHARRGASLPHADYGLDYDQGFEMLLPHLGPSRNLMRLMRADAMVQLHDGHADTAMRRMETMVGMSGHLVGDRTMISSLVGQVIWRGSDEVLEAAMDRGVMTPDRSAALLESMNGLSEVDPFGFVETVMMEQEMVMLSVERTYETTGSLAAIADAAWASDVPAELTDLDADQLHASMEQYGAIMDRTTEIFVAADREAGLAALAALDAAVQAGEFGPLAELLVPNWSKVFEMKLDAEAKLAERRVTLEAIAAGAIAPAERANAALWYVRAAEQLAAWDAGPLSALRRCDADPACAADESLVAALDESDAIWSLLEEAAGMRRCDFSFARPKSAVPLETAPSYAPGLRDLLRLVLVDARRRLRAADAETLARRLHVAWAMTGHLRSDPIHTTAIMTHETFIRLAPLTRAAQETLDETSARELWARANSLGRSDPFGYVAATARVRGAVETLLRGSLPAETDDETRLEMKRAVAALEHRQLYDLAVLVDATTERDAATLVMEDARLAPLADVIDVAKVGRLRLGAPALAAALAAGEINIVDELPYEDAGGLAERTRRARGDLREGLRSLRPAPAAATSGCTQE